jgi:hypothetical protein
MSKVWQKPSKRLSSGGDLHDATLRRENFLDHRVCLHSSLGPVHERWRVLGPMAVTVGLFGIVFLFESG